MRKVIITILYISAVSFLTTCKTENTPSVSSGSWTFQSVTYNDTNGSYTTWGNAIVSIVATAKKNSDVYLVISNDSTRSFSTGTYSLGPGPNTNTTKYLNVGVTDGGGNTYFPLANSGFITVYAQNDTIMAASNGIKCLVLIRLILLSLLSISFRHTD